MLRHEISIYSIEKEYPKPFRAAAQLALPFHSSFSIYHLHHSPRSSRSWARKAGASGKRGVILQSEGIGRLQRQIFQVSVDWDDRRIGGHLLHAATVEATIYVQWI